VLDPFTSNQVSLTYDNNGNLTDDGVLRYVYDAWNRLRKVNRYADGDTTIIAEYKYLGDTRRASKMVQKCGIEYVANDGGNTTVHFYYGSQSPDREGGVAWRIFETRNGSNQSTRQWLWGTQYIDEPVCMDVNSSPTHANDCDPDTSDPGGGTDRRYYYHQDRNFNVVALLETDDGLGTAGRVAERYAYTPYGEFVVLQGQTGSGNLGNILPTSTLGNALTHQGLLFDPEKGAYQNRNREYPPVRHRFLQRDPMEYSGGMNNYEYCRGRALATVDSNGLLTQSVPKVPPPGEDPNDPLNCRKANPSCYVLGYNQRCIPNENELAFFQCCDNKACYVICSDNIRRLFPDPRAGEIMIAAGAEHERSHIEDGACTPKYVYRECKAARRGLRIAFWNAAKCEGDPYCLDMIVNEMGLTYNDCEPQNRGGFHCEVGDGNECVCSMWFWICSLSRAYGIEPKRVNCNVVHPACRAYFPWTYGHYPRGEPAR